MGGAASGSIHFSFNPQLRVEFHGATVTSDTRLLLPLELDERLGLSVRIERPPRIPVLEGRSGSCRPGLASECSSPC